ncbi:putative F420-0 ABC transporter substrate-binding protein [Devosia sp. XJ19-1]|uniref:F420-0 ABC transporter substrate-binding protein n=1 Tax=Devosia ureilytica TaxID=2952754 RepID=A0A9Q4FSU6_9HYPH|nr:putative F420-0 ABC transporter substrate-binding protein [Devosia ureilytica]MCP8884084.1 putative F420-0 ABC transporter substrate-binding protein [Devosia ureilytica]MCP8887692.1 putative F420-0 ABC transporter substrate-binding protein [Devosia ureilytica]
MRHLVVATITLGLLAHPALAATTYPLTLDNCGQAITLNAPPERVVTIKSTATEMVLALGLGERIIGVGFQDGPLPPELALAGSGLAVLSDKLPSQEVVLEAEPDFIYGGWESNFAADGAGERPTLAGLGVTTYVAPAACRSIKPAKLTFDGLHDEIMEMGRIFDVEDQAATLIAEQRAILASITPASGRTALWYSSGTKTPYVGAGSNAPAMIMQAIGLTNIFGAVDEGWTSASWEAVVDANPDVIILVDAAWNSAEQKKQLLAENPITNQLDAVIHQRYLTIPFPAAEAGIRNASAAADLAGQLAGISFEE